LASTDGLLAGRNCFRLFEFIVTETAGFEQFTQLLSASGEIDPLTNAPPHTEFWSR
jgi:hypothetical protein